MRICRSGNEKVTKDEESGDSVIHVGVALAWYTDMRMLRGAFAEKTDLLELVQVRLTLVVPQPVYFLREFKRF